MVQLKLDADLVAFSADEKPVLIGEIKTRPEWSPEILKHLEDYAEWLRADYVMIADLETIKIFKVEDGLAGSPVLEVPTSSVVNHYDPDFNWDRVEWQYFALLLETWFRNVALSVRPEPAPHLERLKEIGFADRLDFGRVEVEWRGFF